MSIDNPPSSPEVPPTPEVPVDPSSPEPLAPTPDEPAPFVDGMAGAPSGIDGTPGSGGAPGSLDGTGADDELTPSDSGNEPS